MILTIDDEFPVLVLPALIPGDLSEKVVESDADYFTTVATGPSGDGRWKVVFFWPKDFTFVCPTEIAEFGAEVDKFDALGADVIGASVDNTHVHFAWRTSHPALRDLPFPMIADMKHELVQACGVENADGVADRATFIIDPAGRVQFTMVSPDRVGRNVGEVLRVLAALQSDELKPCGWNAGEAILDAGALMSESA